MSTGHQGGFPDYSGGGDPYRREHDPYGLGYDSEREHDPYRREHDRYGQREAGGGDPYAVGGSDPYAADPLAADGFAPVFGSSAGGWAGSSAALQSSGPYPHGPTVHGAFPAPQPTSGAAIAALVLGVLGLTMCAGMTAPFGVFFAARGMKETGLAASAPKAGRGLAIAGLVTSLIGLVPLLLMLFYIVVMIIGLAVSAGS